jgi:glycosyltransferase involved in cell wall biosynthesis
MRVLVISEQGHSTYAANVAASLREGGIEVTQTIVGFDRGGLFAVRSALSGDTLEVTVRGRLGILLRHRNRSLRYVLAKELGRQLDGVAAFSKVLVFGIRPFGNVMGRICEAAQVPMLLFPSYGELLSDSKSKRATSMKNAALGMASAVVVDSEVLLSHLPKDVSAKLLRPPLPDGVFRFRPMPMGSSLYVVMAWNWTEEHPVVARPKLAIRALAEAEGELGRPLILGIIGGGERLQELKDYAKGAGLHASFLGELDDEAMARELQRADLFLHPVDLTIHPRAMLAALRCGVPVLASDVEGMSTILGGEGNGMLVPNRLSAWREALLRAVTTDFDRGGIAAANSARFAQAEWTGKLLALIQQR